MLGVFDFGGRQGPHMERWALHVPLPPTLSHVMVTNQTACVRKVEHFSENIARFFLDIARLFLASCRLEILSFCHGRIGGNGTARSQLRASASWR